MTYLQATAHNLVSTRPSSPHTWQKRCRRPSLSTCKAEHHTSNSSVELVWRAGEDREGYYLVYPFEFGLNEQVGTRVGTVC